MKKYLVYVFGSVVGFLFNVRSSLGQIIDPGRDMTDAKPEYGVSEPDSFDFLGSENYSIWEKALRLIVLPIVYIPIIILALVVGVVWFLVRRGRRKGAEKTNLNEGAEKDL